MSDDSDSVTVEVELDSARTVMFKELTESIPQAQLRQDLQSAVEQRLTQLYDNRERLQVDRQ